MATLKSGTDAAATSAPGSPMMPLASTTLCCALPRSAPLCITDFGREVVPRKSGLADCSRSGGLSFRFRAWETLDMTRVLVVGPPRSGTTWIGQVLGRSVATRYVHE